MKRHVIRPVSITAFLLAVLFLFFVFITAFCATVIMTKTDWHPGYLVSFLCGIVLSLFSGRYIFCQRFIFYSDHMVNYRIGRGRHANTKKTSVKYSSISRFGIFSLKDACLHFTTEKVEEHELLRELRMKYHSRKSFEEYQRLLLESKGHLQILVLESKNGEVELYDPGIYSRKQIKKLLSALEGYTGIEPEGRRFT